VRSPESEIDSVARKYRVDRSWMLTSRSALARRLRRSLYRYFHAQGYTMRGIGALMGIGPSSVSAALKGP
jgi:hypothetical protein